MASIAVLCGAALLVAGGEVDPAPVPGCGVAAAYSYLRCQGRTISLAAVTREVAAGRADFDPFAVSVADIQQALHALGAKTEAIRVDPRSVAGLSRPSILYLRPGRWPRARSGKAGHFVTLVDVVGADAVLLDWTPATTRTAIKMPVSQLAAVWDGEAVTSGRAWTGSFYSVAGAAITIAGVALCAWFGSRTARRSRAVALALSLVAGAPYCAGCSSSAETGAVETAQPLVFDQPVAIKGTVPSQTPVAADFSFRVWDEGPVTITGFETTCGCTTPDTDLVGQEFAPGSEHLLRVRIRPDGEGRTITRIVQIHTDPAPASPITVAVQYRRQDPPRISRNPIWVSQQPGTIPTTEVEITYRRPPGGATVTLARDGCHGTHFEIESVTAATETVKVDSTADVDMTVDTTHVKLRGREPLAYGEHSGAFTFAFDDGSVQTVETRSIVPHPLEPQLRHVFCGFLRPGERWSRSVACQRAPGASVGAASLHVDGTGLRARIVDDDRIEITGEAPPNPGRFERLVWIKFSPDSIPPVRIPVTGIVRAENERK